MEERYLNKKIFQPLVHLDADPTTGYQKYYNEYFSDVVRPKKEESNRSPSKT